MESGRSELELETLLIKAGEVQDLGEQARRKLYHQFKELT